MHSKPKINRNKRHAKFSGTTTNNCNHLNDVDDVIGKPENGKGDNDHQDETTALSSALKLGTLQSAYDGGVAGADEREGNQAAHDGLKQVLEDRVTYAPPVVWHANVHGLDIYNTVEKTQEERMRQR